MMKDKWMDLTAESRTLRERLILCAAVTLFASFTLCFFAPLELLMTNSRDIWFRASQVWWCFALFTLGVFACLTGLGLLLRGRLLDLYLCLAFGLTLGLYLQGNFLNIDYGTLTGDEIRWERYGAYSLVNTLIAAGIAALPAVVRYFSAKVWKRAVQAVSIGIVLVQAVTLAVLALTPKPEQEMTFGGEGAFSLSQQSNVIWIVVDRFDNDFMDVLLANEPDALAEWTGFTYYPDTAGIAGHTRPALAEALTQKLYHLEEGYFSYLESAWSEPNLIMQMKTEGYDVRVLSETDCFGDVTREYIDNYVPNRWQITSYPGMLQAMMRFVAFRYLPHALKAGFWLHTGDLNHFRDPTTQYTLDDPIVYRWLGDSPVQGDCAKPAFRLYHLMSMHPGYWVDAEMNYAPDSSGYPLEQSKGAVLLLNRLFSQMKQAGVYDNSLIVIAADHGDFDPPKGGSPDKNWMKCLNPVLLVKPAGASGGVRQSSAPAWVMDIVPTILEQTGISVDAEMVGVPLSTLDEDMARTRYFYGSDEIGDQTEITEFRIEGDCNRPETWTETGRVWKGSEDAR